MIYILKFQSLTPNLLCLPFSLAPPPPPPPPPALLLVQQLVVTVPHHSLCYTITRQVLIINNFKDGLHPPATQRDINLQVLSHRLCVIGERLEVSIKEGPTVINVTEYVPNVTQLIEKTKISYQ